jgi:alcohol dehydrogenase YqhD (iron-dependent ADH family)
VQQVLLFHRREAGKSLLGEEEVISLKKRTMDNFTFYNPTKVIFGKDTIPLIGREIRKARIKKVLLLAGGGSIKGNGAYDAAVKSLGSAGIEWQELWGVQPNPVLSHALKAIDIVKEHNIEAVLAIGGGSVIDEAKSVAAGAFLDNLWSAFEREEAIERALPVFSILTLSGTCSEMDPFAVLTNEEDKKKWNIGSELLFPKVSIIDPSVQMSLPWKQTANGAIDALSHIMEFYFIGTDEEVSISLSEALMRTIIKSVDSLQNDPSDYAARANLAWSATLALNGVAGAALKGGDWSAHRIEHGISAIHPEVAHGAGLAVVFPAWIEYMQEYNPAQFERWARNVWGCNSVREGLEAMKSKFRQWEAPVTLGDLKINESEIETIAKNAIGMGVIGYFVPVDANVASEILKIAVAG